MTQERVAELPRKREARWEAQYQPMGPREAEVMDILWRDGPATVAQVREKLQGPRPAAYTTIMTIMVRLRQKGLLRRARAGNAYIYSPSLSRDEVWHAAARGFFDGLMGALGKAALVPFVERLAQLDKEALAELESLLQDYRKKRE
ncbi:MAG: BlaI/MecI/CopY family transcriptional regulator [Chloroflexi bacterium]|nr:BlaI/MecI/CopY family transcriptional regulator [Chloroflexota bacterium]